MTALKSMPPGKHTDIEKRCAAAGMRMTEQRRVIARVLAEAMDHPDVEELYRRCIAVDDKISISTVYRTVKLFEDAGIIERHDFREGRARYPSAARIVKRQWHAAQLYFPPTVSGRNDQRPIIVSCAGFAPAPAGTASARVWPSGMIAMRKMRSFTR